MQPQDILILAGTRMLAAAATGDREAIDLAYRWAGHHLPDPVWTDLLNRILDVAVDITEEIPR